MDWILGLSIWFTIIGGAFLYAHVALKFVEEKQSQTKTDYKEILAKQAAEADRRWVNRTYEHPSYDHWLNWAAKSLRRIWPSVSYEEARIMIRDYMTDIAVYPDPDFDWSLAAAREVAEEYAREYGEHYGSNS